MARIVRVIDNRNKQSKKQKPALYNGWFFAKDGSVKHVQYATLPQTFAGGLGRSN